MKKVEICCGSYYDALQAQYGGASRIELNSALHMGGLTPSLGTFLQVKENTDLEIICMVRGRGGGFYYDEEDKETMFLDAEILLDNGADGIAFGFLDEESDIDIKSTREMVQLIHSYGKVAVFHRAFDCVLDVDQTMNILIQLGVDRILTSGQQKDAIAGKQMIKYLHDCYGDYIEIIAGGGINADNALKLMEYTGVSQVHSSCKEWLIDPTTSGVYGSFSYHNDDYDVVSFEKVETLIDIVEDDDIMYE